MKNFIIMFLAACLITGLAYRVNAQSVGINDDGSSPNSKAILDVSSTTKGFLPPRMTTAEIANIPTPANGLMVYNTTDKKLYIYVSATSFWKEVTFGTGTISPTFVCGNSFADSRDGKVYATMLIGTQCWMKENLNVGERINGTVAQENNSNIEKYCNSDNDANCTTYGGLYQWDEMMQYSTTPGVQGICPSGWHLPTTSEWSTLTSYVSSQSTYLCNSNSSYIAKSLAATTNWITATGTCFIGENLAANNATGFTVLPGGNREPVGTFNVPGYDGRFWSSSENSANAVGLNMSNGSAVVSYIIYVKGMGSSVRCVKDL